MYASGAAFGAAVPVKEKNEKNIKNVLTKVFRCGIIIKGYSYLAGINILVYAKQEVLDDLTQKEKLFCAI